ncbi:Abi-alpha family protein [Pseudomonas fulva]|uniref:Abi-alpha family protein n=1 Tax=Pseudomonas putida group TaxID=136845 RepID=UPI0009BAA5E1
MDIIPKVEVKLDLTPTLETTYQDAVSPLLQEAGKLGTDVVRTFRLALFPLQLASYYQQRLENYLSEALHRVPEEDRVKPVESLVLQISDKLRFQEEGSLLTEMYLELLTCAFDKRRCGQAHPAFTGLISQLSPDEAILLNHLAGPLAKIYIGKELLSWTEHSRDIKSHLTAHSLEPVELDWDRFITPEILSQPAYLQLYIQHLVTLGLIEYDNNRPRALAVCFSILNGQPAWAVKLSEFGNLFHAACTQGPTIRATTADRI